ncbi:MAG TPA: hypothetical protein VGU69_16890, partial [Rhizomicrobium sp.]|nr:hypothetical protein [Rhizomicrobium sp.]
MFHADRKRGLIPALLMGTAFAAVGIAPAFADDQVETVVVTGSLISNNSNLVSPITVIGQKELDQRGISTIQGAIQQSVAINGPA